jgi:ribonuclease III
MTTPASSRPSARRSTTSSPTRSKRPEDAFDGPHELGRLIAELPDARLEQVFTHASWADDRSASYERLEFLGDSVLELAIARAVFDRFPEASEGRLAKIRAHVVSRQSCAQVAKELALGDRLLQFAGDIPPDELQRISRSRNVLAAVLEAAIAALYLEHGFERIEPAIVAAFGEKIEYARSSHVDYKTELQEALARSGKQVHYTVLEVEGPPHDRRFVCAAHVAGVQLGVGKGSTKKAAEQEAAMQALDELGVVPEQL